MSDDKKYIWGRIFTFSVLLIQLCNSNIKRILSTSKSTILNTQGHAYTASQEHPNRGPCLVFCPICPVSLPDGYPSFLTTCLNQHPPPYRARSSHLGCSVVPFPAHPVLCVSLPGKYALSYYNPQSMYVLLWWAIYVLLWWAIRSLWAHQQCLSCRRINNICYLFI